MNDESIVRGRRQLLRGLAAATGAGSLRAIDRDIAPVIPSSTRVNDVRAIESR